MEFHESARSRTIAQHSELSVEGGEVGFVGRMIEESASCGDRIAIFTTLLGKKSSLKELSPVFHEVGVQNHHWWTIGQGRTCRWILGWTLRPDIKLE
jgi:23S rRNA A1618 N6-methylase RlmF